MHQIIFLLAFFHAALNEEEPKAKLMKPNFKPYCVTRHICWSDCECTVADNCTIIPMSNDTSEKILTVLNHKRDMQSTGEPVPSGMPMLLYDHQLEELSQCWATKCENIYSECFKTEKFNETSQSVGQIILEENINPSPKHWIKMVDTWSGEVASLDYGPVKILPEGDLGENIHNYAQLLSDKVFFVGCAWSISGRTITFVCTFGPRGPNPGEEIYRTGKICTGCSEGYECNSEKPFEKLCKKLEVKTKLENTTATEVKNTTGKKGVSEEDRKARAKLARAVTYDPKLEEDDKDYTILWLFALGLILIILTTVLVFALFYILRLGSIETC